MIGSAKAVDMLIDSVVTSLVTQSEQALHHVITELELIAAGLDSGMWTDGLQKTSVWPDVVSAQATSSRAVNDTTISDKLASSTKARESDQCFLDFVGTVLAEAQMARVTDVVVKGKRQSASKKMEATCQTCFGPSSHATNWRSRSSRIWRAPPTKTTSTREPTASCFGEFLNLVPNRNTTTLSKFA